MRNDVVHENKRTGTKTGGEQEDRTEEMGRVVWGSAQARGAAGERGGPQQPATRRQVVAATVVGRCRRG